MTDDEPKVRSVGPREPRAGCGRRDSAMRWLMVGLLAAVVGSVAAIGVARARSRPGLTSGSPVRLKAVALTRSGQRLTGTVMVTVPGTSAVPATEAALALRPKRGRGLEGADDVALPRLAAGARRQVVFAGRIPDGTRAGRYQVLGCVDVASQLTRFNPSRDCVLIGSIRISRGPVLTARSAAPQTRLTGRPRSVSSTQTASFRFASDVRASRFQCRLDDGPWLTCASPRRYVRLVVGGHDFAVRALTRDGRTDPSPAQASWRISTPRPTITTPQPTTTAPTPTPAPTPSVTAPTPNPAPAPATAITVDTADPGETIDPAIFGSDYLAPFGGMGSYDAATDGFWPSFTAQLTSAVGAGSLRFPGGITGQSYSWMRAVGPQSGRGDNPVGPNGRPSPSTVGPDEFGQLLDLTGAQGVYDVDFANGTAQEAADLVQYMTGTDTSNPFVEQRIQNGHPAPYDVPYWEVGNEEQTPQFWRAGSIVAVTNVAGLDCPDDPTGLYICGGTTRFSGQAVVGDDDGDRSPASSVSTGTGDQSFQVAYPPVSGTPTVTVKGVTGTWTEVSSLSGQSASAQVFTLDPSTGTISFGDGVHGAIPPDGDTVTATYDSGPHDGFDQFDTAMKAANPSIDVCATDTGTSFIDDAGASLPYDCLQDHPYVGTGAISASLPIDQYEADVMAVPDTQAANVASLQAQVDQTAGRHVPLVLTEYGQLISSTPDPAQVPDYLNSLDEALVNASQLADWIRLGIPVADRQLLAAELPDPSAVTAGLPGAAPFATTGAITTTGGSQTVVQPTGQFLGLMEPLAGGNLLPTTLTGDPAITGATPATGDLSVVSAATPLGTQLVVINRSPTDSVTSVVSLTGPTESTTATMATLDGPSPLSDNTSQAPDTVTTTPSAWPLSDGIATITFPAHSISMVTVPGS